MPPKKAPKVDKSVQKAKQKAVEDKTFGLKNKNKSSKVKKNIQQLQAQATSIGNNKAKVRAEERKQSILSKKELEAQKKAELAELFKPVQQQKVPFGTDPKTVLCSFFKAGQCQKGKGCKFSHDLNIDRKTTKKDLYTDHRDDQANDNMEDWDQAKLEEVVTSKHGNPRTTTDIVCKFFLEAIENQKYGWFWECPNGGNKCKYRHALPPGFVLKSKKKEEEKEEISIEDFLETERHKLGKNLTPVTLESFMEWKKNRKAKQEAEASEAIKAKEAAFKAGKSSNMSGRELFDFNPDLVSEGLYDDDDGVFDFSAYRDKEVDEAAEGISNLDVNNESLFEQENLDDLDDDDDDEE
ncbi:hypothetical protein K493DRAFT_219769 [Basidiobolus meristosporus CBS 931.73]|uniref:C3H1-type domain-containing protein n=1 Tax=Basidiobolus meristosporus CBS 931.73 TaxID=1314790 RepID=A0A1Y1YB13_9FUNG|nr:hypothetical protein K493DRAFT_219769 [Basidiobolus meristosporus CBS 931.73]|eukprot:ORX95163.1 hypothetical protein K493DRAFT_219769 [Basidiobolus meristosporus CBS 931.73]